MTIETARSFFLWCTVINFGLLLVWALVATIGRNLVYGLCRRVFRVSPEQFDLLNLGGITLYKMAIFLLNLVPCIVFHILKLRSPA